jgi:hypothetical protein
MADNSSRKAHQVRDEPVGMLLHHDLQELHATIVPVK